MGLATLKGPAQAATITYEFSGTLDSYSFAAPRRPDLPAVGSGLIPADARFGHLAIGDREIGRYTVDTVSGRVLACAFGPVSCIAPGATLDGLFQNSGGSGGFLLNGFPTFEFKLDGGILTWADDIGGTSGGVAWSGEGATFRDVSIGVIPLPVPALLLLAGLAGLGALAWRRS